MNRSNLESDLRYLEGIKLCYDFKSRTALEASTKVVQALVIFLAASSIITVAGAFSNMGDGEKKVLLYSASILFVVVFFASLVFVYGIVMGLVQIRRTLLLVSREAFLDCEMDRYFRRGIACTVLAVVVGVIGLTSILLIVFDAELVSFF